MKSRKCLRCGKRCRADNASDALCGHCSRTPEHLTAIGPGEWVRDGLVYRWEAAADPLVCGTERGYDRHRKRGEKCDECREAHRLFRAQERQAQRTNGGLSV